MPNLSVGVWLISRPITKMWEGKRLVNRKQLNPCNYVARNLHRSALLFRGSSRSTFRRWPRPEQTRLRMDPQPHTMTRPTVKPAQKKINWGYIFYSLGKCIKVNLDHRIIYTWHNERNFLVVIPLKIISKLLKLLWVFY